MQSKYPRRSTVRRSHDTSVRTHDCPDRMSLSGFCIGIIGTSDADAMPRHHAVRRAAATLSIASPGQQVLDLAAGLSQYAHQCNGSMALPSVPCQPGLSTE